ncbi:hypothetical protein ES703_85093 [subsurface metagenome]
MLEHRYGVAGEDCCDILLEGEVQLFVGHAEPVRRGNANRVSEHQSYAGQDWPGLIRGSVA